MVNSTPELIRHNLQPNAQLPTQINCTNYPKLKGFKIGHLNIASLVKHVDELEIFIQSQPFDVLCINETRLDNTVSSSEVKITCYDLIRKDRNRNGGGVAIYVRNTILYKDRNDLLSNDVEAICIEINKPNSKPFLISTWYRPPNANIEILHSFEEFLQKVDAEDKDIVITGDFNCNFLAFELGEHTRKLSNLINEYQLKQVIVNPTRITVSTKTLLDIIITKIDDTRIVDSGVMHVGISDHSLVYACRKISIPKTKPKVIETRQFKNFNRHNFQNDLIQAFNTIHLYNYTDANTAWNVWKETFLDTADYHAPVIKRKVKSEYNPWMTNEIKTMSYHREFLKKKAVKHNSARYHELYKDCRNRVNQLIKDTKAAYYKNKLANSKNSKEGWKTINELLNKNSKSTVINEIKAGEVKIIGDKNIAEEFNKYFSTIGSKLSDDLPISEIDPLSYITPSSETFYLNNIINTDLRNELKKAKDGKSAGLDRISNKLLKAAGESIVTPLTYIINLSISTGIFPDDLKNTKVTPIFKSGDKTECGNYRPISVTSAVAKIYEKLIHNQLSQFLEDNQILSPSQSGFRTQHSTETTLLHSVNQCLVNMDRGLINGLLFLDLKKAFDTVDHKILVSKLELYGIKGKALSWFISYLTGRKQACKINHEISDLANITCGVPQGSILGPLLFLLYINDLPNCLTSTNVSMFADDTNLFCHGKSSLDIEQKINIDLDNVHKWLVSNKLTLNIKKTEYMITGSRQRLNQLISDPEINITEHKIARVESKKFLGVIVDKNFKWHEHIDMQCRKISKNIALLRRAKKYMTKNALKMMYNSLILPHFTYCSTVWHNGNITHIDKLNKLQKRAARIITNSDFDTRSVQIFNTLQWEPIGQILKQRDEQMTFKAIRGMTPAYLTELFSICQNSNYTLRSNDRKLTLPKPSTNFLKNSFSYRGAVAWNNLPSEILENYECISLNAFKRLSQNKEM